MAPPFPPPVTPMEARVRVGLPAPPGWAYEPKWDGFRCVAWGGPGRGPNVGPGPGRGPSVSPAGTDGGVRLDSRNQRPLLRYFPELIPALEVLPDGTVVDGEVIVVRGAQTDFDALQQRIHPADSRVRMLAEETPAELVAFDLLAVDGEDLRERPFGERRQRLERLAGQLGPPWHLTPSTTDVEVAARWFDEFESAGCDGIVAKHLDGPYIEGERAMVKVKHRRTVDCVVGGYRVHKEGDRIGSLLLGLHNDAGQLHFIGHCSGFSDVDRVALLKRVQPLEVERSATEEPTEGRLRNGFGDDARRPGGVSRWSGGKDLSWVPVRPELVCEISYDQLTGERFRHATRFERWRPDKDPLECRMDQLERPEGPSFGDVVVQTS